jgi:hypothetical protein
MRTARSLSSFMSSPRPSCTSQSFTVPLICYRRSSTSRACMMLRQQFHASYFLPAP